MENKKIFIIDFDSTITKIEALDLLCEISLKNHPDKENMIKKVKETTNLAMSGKLSFNESLKTRISLIKANKSHIKELINELKNLISNSFERNKEFIQKNASQFYIISSGFKDFILPVISDFNIKEENVFANTFIYNEREEIIGFDEKNPLSSDKGKPKVLEQLKLKGEIFVLGDGFTDYEIKKEGQAKTFYAFTENIKREDVVKLADKEITSFDSVLHEHKMISYPKNKINVLLLENIHPNAVKMMKEKEGYNVEILAGSLDEDELCSKIQDIHVLGIRSKTHVTEKVLQNAKKLMCIGAFCIGTNQIDLDVCKKKGIAVFNAPYSNTRSVVELAIGEIILLMRNLPDKASDMHKGKWDKSATGSFEIRNKTLGIIGYGNIGTQLSTVAEMLGMKVIFYDLEEKLPLGNAKKMNSLEELLAISDVISLHVDGRKSNDNFIGEAQFNQMKDGVIFLNLSRGKIVVIDALKNAILSGKVRGAGVDVFPEEPKSNNESFESPLKGLPNIILTPHIGGSTLEAQIDISNFVPQRMINFINTGATSGSVNFPNLSLPKVVNSHRFIHIHKNVPGVVASINNILSKNGINIVSNYLKTDEEIGYVICDVDQGYKDEILKELKKIPETIRFRVLY